MLYGGFIEHIGNLINHSLWSEVLDDRKFYYGAIAGPESKPSNPRAAMAFINKWVAIGPVTSIQLDKTRPYVGDHSLVISLEGGKKLWGYAAQFGFKVLYELQRARRSLGGSGR